MATLRIEMLGPFRLTADGISLNARLGGKTLGLIAYLAMHPNAATPRDEIVELLWPDRFPEQGRLSLRQALSAARKSFGKLGPDLIRTDGGDIALSPTVFETDVQEFERLSASPDLDERIKAASLYRADFLGGLRNISDPFDAWAANICEGLKTKTLILLEELSTEFRDSNNYAAALELAERLIAIDPAYEAGHCLLIELYALSGRRSLAARQYKACCRALAQYLDVEPNEKTKELFEKVRSGALTSKSSTEKDRKTPQKAPKIVRRLPRRFRFSHFVFRHRSLVTVSLSTLFFLVAVGVYSFSDLSRNTAQQPKQFTTENVALCDQLKQIPPSEEPILIVMPLMLTGDAGNKNLLSYIVTDAIVSTVVIIPRISVVTGPNAAHEDSTLDVTQLAAKHNATHILQSHLNLDHSVGPRMTLRLIDGATGRQLWQDGRTLSDEQIETSELQNAFALSAWQGVHETLTDGQQALGYRLYEPASMEVIEHNTIGFGHLNLTTPLHNQLARTEFARALAIDEDHPGANAGMGFTFLSPMFLRWQKFSEKDAETAEEYARHALDARDNYVPALNLLALTTLFEGDIDGALTVIERALSVNGGGADATIIYAYILSYTEETATSVEAATRAIRLRPYAHPEWHDWVFARSLRLNGQYDGALDCLERIQFQERSAIAPAFEAALARLALGHRRKAKLYIDTIAPYLSDGFTKEDYCRWPVRTPSLEQTKACEANLQLLGL